MSIMFLWKTNIYHSRLSVESSARLFLMADTRRRHSVTTTDASDININMDSCPLKSSQKHVTLEITTSTFNRKLQVKTKQEDRICKGNRSLSPVETQLSLIHHQQISEPLKSSSRKIK